MSEDYSRWLAVSFALITGIVAQIAGMVAWARWTIVDWVVLGALLLAGYGQFDGRVPDPG